MHTVVAIASSSSSASRPWGRGVAMAKREEGDGGGPAAMVARHSSHRPATFLSAASPAFRPSARRPPLPRRRFSRSRFGLGERERRESYGVG
jgi:hypothetical protein